MNKFKINHDAGTCPSCKSDNSHVIESRFKHGTIWRRRECFDCGERYNTLEILADDLNDLKQKQDIVDGILKGLRESKLLKGKI